MKILLCADHSSFTDKFLATARTFIDAIHQPEVTVLHIIDERMFYATTGYEVELGNDLERESNNLKGLCKQYLGTDIDYREEYGIPKLKIDEVLEETTFDLLIAGSHSQHTLADRIVGSFAEHILQKATRPVLIIP